MNKRFITIVILLTVFMVSCEPDPIFYQVTLKNGDLEIAQKNVAENSDFIFLSDKEPTKQDYIFVGWSSDYGITIYNTGDKVAIIRNVVFNAQWEYLAPAPTEITKTDETRIGLNDGTLVGVNSTQEYQVNGVGEWIAITESTVTGLVPGSYTVRVKATEKNKAGVETSPFIIAEATEKQNGPPAPTEITKTDETRIGLNDGTLAGVNSTQEYQVNGVGDWIAITESTVTGLAPGSYTVRVKATEKNKAGVETSPLIIAEATEKQNGPPAPTEITKTDETRIGLNDGTLAGVNSTQEYQVNGVGDWIAITESTVTGLAPGSYTVRVKATEYNKAGVETSPLIIAEATEKQNGPPAPTEITKTDETRIGLNDGTLAGVNSTQEYQVNGVGEWIAITESTVTGLVPGSYTVRVKATEKNKAGVETSPFIIAEATEKQNGPPAPTEITKTDETRIGLNDGTLAGVNSTQEYQVNGVGDWIAITGSTVTDLAPGSYTVRVRETNTHKVGFKTSALIIDEVAVSDIVLSSDSLILVSNGEIKTITAIIKPSDASDNTIDWKSNNPDIVTVDSGKVTSLSSGSTTITATAGDKVVELDITVKEETSALDFIFDKATGTIISYNGYSRNVVIPIRIDDTDVKVIGASAFYYRALQSVYIPNSVTNIGAKAFSNNSLISVTIPSSVKILNYDAFLSNGLYQNSESISPWEDFIGTWNLYGYNYTWYKAN